MSLICRKTKNFLNRNSRWIGPDLHTGRESIKNCPKALMLALSIFFLFKSLFSAYTSDDYYSFRWTCSTTLRPLPRKPTDHTVFCTPFGRDRIYVVSQRQSLSAIQQHSATANIRTLPLNKESISDWFPF